jgi:hypothetical protein
MTTASIWLSVRARDVWSVAREVAGERGRAGFRQARAQRLLKQLFNAFPEDAEEHQSCDHGGYPDDDWRSQLTAANSSRSRWSLVRWTPPEFPLLPDGV